MQELVESVKSIIKTYYIKDTTYYYNRNEGIYAYNPPEYEVIRFLWDFMRFYDPLPKEVDKWRTDFIVTSNNTIGRLYGGKGEENKGKRVIFRFPRLTYFVLNAFLDKENIKTSYDYHLASSAERIADALQLPTVLDEHGKIGDSDDINKVWDFFSTRLDDDELLNILVNDIIENLINFGIQNKIEEMCEDFSLYTPLDGFTQEERSYDVIRHLEHFYTEETICDIEMEKELKYYKDMQLNIGIVKFVRYMK